VETTNKTFNYKLCEIQSHVSILLNFSSELCPNERSIFVSILLTSILVVIVYYYCYLIAVCYYYHHQCLYYSQSLQMLGLIRYVKAFLCITDSSITLVQCLSSIET
jgi:hypothetical protein